MRCLQATGAVGVSAIIRCMNEPQNSLPQAYDDEIDLWELWDTVWSGRWLIIGITALFAIGGVTYALRAQDWSSRRLTKKPCRVRSGNWAASRALPA